MASPEFRKPSINLNVTAKAWVNKTEIPADKMQSNFLGEWRSQASKAFEESTLFSEVKLSSDDITDMQADIDIERRVESAKPWRLSPASPWVCLRC